MGGARRPDARPGARAAGCASAIDDDGAGLSAQERADVLGRGRRLDERVPGSGLGLAIVADIALLYGGTLTLERAAAGGLSARLDLPAAAGPRTRRARPDSRRARLTPVAPHHPHPDPPPSRGRGSFARALLPP